MTLYQQFHFSPPPSQPGDPTWEMALLYPAQGSWTEEEYLRLDIGRIVEFNNGVLEFSPLPTYTHQFIVEFLFDRLREYVNQRQLGRVVLAPCPVRVAQRQYREPDISVVPWSQLSDLTTPPTVVNLTLEVVSPGEMNRRRDWEEKVQDYAQAGFPEYWIVDPEQELIRVLSLENGQYRLHGEFRAGEQATSVALPGFAVDVAAVWQAGRNLGPKNSPHIEP